MGKFSQGADERQAGLLELDALLQIAEAGLDRTEEARIAKSFANEAKDLASLLQWSGQEEAAHSVAAMAVQVGEWQNPLQLPYEYFPELAAKPWYPRIVTDTTVTNADVTDVNLHNPTNPVGAELAAALAIIDAAHGPLANEAAQLVATSKLPQQSECLHDQTGGAWRYLPVLRVSDRFCHSAVPTSLSYGSVIAGASDT
jgi:hypothetical protein